MNPFSAWSRTPGSSRSHSARSSTDLSARMVKAPLSRPSSRGRTSGRRPRRPGFETGWIRRRCSSGRAALCTPSTFPPRFSGFRKTGPGFTGRSAGGAPSGSTAFAASRAPVRAAFPWRQRSGFSTAEPPAGTRRSSKSWGWRSPVSLLLEIRTLPFAGFARRMRNDGPGCGTPPGFPLSGMARAATWAAAARLRNAQLS